MKNYIGVSRDHSGSMQSLTGAAVKDYNNLIISLGANAKKHSIATVVSVVKCGDRRGSSAVIRAETLVPVDAIKEMRNNEYNADGPGTPLFDSILNLIEQFENTPDVNDENVSFVIMAVTDGGDNASRPNAARILIQKIRELQRTDRWTIVLRVPKGHSKQHLISIGFDQGNITEWDLTTKGMEASSQATVSAFDNFYSDRVKGVRSTKTFYTSLTEVKPSDVKSVMTEITAEVVIYNVAPANDGRQIRDIYESLHGLTYKKGIAFYQLMKREKEVQDYKQIVIKHRKSGKVYGGNAARDLLGIPKWGTHPVAPDDLGQYDVYVQSTSVNRKLFAGSKLLIWLDAPKDF